MRKLISPIYLSTLAFSFAFIPLSQQTNSRTADGEIVLSSTESRSAYLSLADISAELYNDINLEQYGLPVEAFALAYKGYQYLLSRNRITRAEYLSICDFSQSSKQKRFYLIDIANKCLVLNTYVAHGRNSGGEYANNFSNIPSSLQSSLGFYITQNTYYGEHGLALKILGVDRGFNCKALQRNIVIHGANYIDDNWLRRHSVMGRSYGCPALPKNESSTIINTIRGGTCLFIYHPAEKYLNGSKILND